MPALIPNKYVLKSLHEEIGLLDRKLTHLHKFQQFPSDKERNAEAARLTTKRAQLVRNARQLATDGVEFKLSDLPLSLRPDAAESAPGAEPHAAPEAVVPASQGLPS